MTVRPVKDQHDSAGRPNPTPEEIAANKKAQDAAAGTKPRSPR